MMSSRWKHKSFLTSVFLKDHLETIHRLDTIVKILEHEGKNEALPWTTEMRKD